MKHKSTSQFLDVRRAIANQIQFMIAVEHGYLHIPRLMQVVVIILSYLQSVSFLVTPTSKSIDILILGSPISELLNVLPLVTRPYTYITQLDILRSREEFIIYAFLVAFALHITCLLTVIIFSLTIEKVDLRKKGNVLDPQQLSTIQYYWLWLISAFLQCYNSLLMIPSLELSMHSFKLINSKLSGSGQDINYLIAALAIFNIVIIIVFSILKLFITEETNNMEINGFEKLNFTIQEVLLLIIRMIQPIIFVVDWSTSVSIYLHSICILSVCSISIRNILLSRTIAGQQSQHAHYHGISASLGVAIFFLVFEVSASPIEDRIVLILLTYSFLVRLLLQINEQLFGWMIINQKKVQSPAQIQSVIYYTLNHEFMVTQTRKVLFQTIVITKHRKKCLNVDCFCRNSCHQISDAQQIYYITDEMLQDFCISLMKQLNRKVRKLKNDYEKFSFTLHYIAGLSLLGKNNNSFQSINILLQGSTGRVGYGYRDSNNSQYQNHSFHNSQKNSESAHSSEKQKHNAKFDNMNDKFLKNYRSLAISHMDKLNIIQVQRAKILQQQIKKKLNSNFASQTASSNVGADNISHAVQLVLDSENSNQNLKSKIVKLMQLKLGFFNLMTSSVNINGQVIFQKSQQLGAKLKATEQQLYKLYEKFPSQKIQSVITFFEAEIMNNYLQAYRIASVTTIADEKLMKLHKNLSINLFSNSITYLIVTLDENTQSLVINQASNMAYEFFQYTADDFKQIKTIDPLLPYGVQQMHRIFINQFFQTGKSKYFRNPSLTFTLRKDNFIVPIDFFFDIDFSNMSNFSIACFIETLTFTSAYIMVDINGVVGGVSRTLFEKLGMKSQEIKSIDLQSTIYKTQISNLIPDFEQFCDVESEFAQKHLVIHTSGSQIKYSNLPFQILKPQFLISQNGGKVKTVQSLWSTQPSKTRHTLNDSWQNKQYLQKYTAISIINQRTVDGINYYIIEIEDLKLVSESVKSHENQQTIYQNESLSKMELSNLNEKQQEAMNWSHILDPDNLDLSVENRINEPQALDLCQNHPQGNKDQFRMNNSFAESQRSEVEPQENQNQQIRDKLQILSPDASISGLINNNFGANNHLLNQGAPTPITVQQSAGTNLLIQLKQQRFYKSKEESVEQNSSQNQQTVHANQQQNQMLLYDMQGIDEEFKQNVLQMLHDHQQEDPNVVKIDDGASQVSSIAGVRKSPFYKKYDMLLKVIHSKKQASQIHQMNAILTFAFMLCIAFSVIVLILASVETDLQKFINELDLLQVNNHFLAPIVQFTAMRQGSSRYDNQFRDGLIDNVTQLALTSYMTDRILEQYDLMRDNYFLQFQNSYLQEFFKDRYLVVSQGMRINNVYNFTPVYYNVTLRETLNIQLTNMFTYTLTYKGLLARNLVIQGPPQFFMYSNMIQLLQMFEGLSDQILDYQTARNDTVKNKWNFIYIPFLCAVLVLAGLAWLSYKLYLRKLERIMTMFRYISLQALEKDRDRYKVLLTILNKDMNMVFKYTFNLEQKEKILFLTKQKKESTQQRQHVKHNAESQLNGSLMRLRLPVMKSLTAIVAIISLSAALFSAINFDTQSFLTKYKNTAFMFRQTSDLGFYLPYMFMCREILVNIETFPFTPEDVQELYRKLDVAYENIGTFNTKILKFNRETFLVTDEFMKKFQRIKQDDICQFVNETLRDKSELYCKESLGGVLQRGLIITLDKLKTIIQNEQQINNFTARAAYPYLQIEAELLTQQVSEYLKTEIKNGLIELSSNHIEVINTLCIICVVYSIFVILIQYTVALKYFQNEFTLVKRLVLLMPSTSLFFDDQFERVIRLLMVQEKIV